MTSVLAAAEEAVSWAVTKAVCEGEPVAVGQARTDTHQVVGLAMELSRHPSGQRDLAAPVVVSFHREQWLRIAVCLKGLR